MRVSKRGKLARAGPGWCPLLMTMEQCQEQMMIPVKREETKVEDGDGWSHPIIRVSKREEMAGRQLATRIGRDALEGRRRSRREEMSSRQTATRIGKRGIPGLDHDWKTRIGRRAPNSIVLPVFFFRIARRT